VRNSPHPENPHSPGKTGIPGQLVTPKESAKEEKGENGWRWVSIAETGVEVYRVASADPVKGQVFHRKMWE
jgi:hypothetical protein